MSRVMRPAAVVEYPYSDGRPMAESEAQLRAIVYLVAALYGHFRDRSDVYVGGDMFLYYEKGNPAAVVAPDVFVVIGAPKRAEDRRLSYKLWEEPKGPDFVLEVASRSTWPADRDRKRALYASLGVEEYWLYDPTGERVRSRLRAMRLVEGGYRELAPEAAALEGRYLRSAVVGLDVRVDGAGELHARNPVTGEEYLMPEEEHVARLAAESRARREAAAREAEAMAREAAESRARREAAARQAEAMAREAAESRARREAAAREAEAAAREAAELRAGREAKARRAEVAAREASDAQVAELQARLRELEGGRTDPGGTPPGETQ